MRQNIDCWGVRLCMALFFILISGTLFAQKVVTGTVSNSSNNQPIPSATVTVKGTNIGAATDASGKFSINVPAGKNTLVISSVGFAEQEVDISATTSVTVSLKERVSSLDEIVVTGYTVQKKKDITGAVSVVNVKDLKTIPAGSPEQMLQGQAAGVNVITSGSPGAPSNILIRGITSFGSNSPLIIIDGLAASLRDINANDIESLQVLKDAGAASIYGVRGANGVIIITTKKGRAGKATISYDGYVGTQQPPSGNPFNLLNPQEYSQAFWTANINAGQVGANGNPTSVQYGNGSEPVLPDYITPGGASEGDPAVNPDLYNTDYSKGNIYQITKANKAGTDWFHEAFKPALIQSHTLTASGGGDKSAYLFSVGYFDQEGTLINTYLRRYDVRINTSFNVKNNIRVGENAYLFYKENPHIDLDINAENVINTVFRQQSIIPVYDIAGGWAGTNGPELGNGSNPVASQKRTQNDKSYNWDMVGNVWGEIDFLKHFTARTSFGGTIDNGYFNAYTYHTYENAENNSGNSFEENSFYNSNWTWTNSLTYTNTFAEKHNVKVLVGSEAINYFGRAIGGTRLNYFTDEPDLRVLDAGSPTNQTLYGRAYRNTLFSLFGRLDYAYSGKYLLSATIRRDGSSVFGADTRYGNFPAFSLGWRISQEEFMKGITWINDLKLRGSWGKLGSQNNVDRSNQYTIYNSAGQYSYYDITGSNSSIVQGFYASRIGNLKTGWEEDIITNFGLDATILKNKLDLSVEYYKKKVNGLLFSALAQTGATVGGATLPSVNIGDVQNTGVDASVTYHGTIGKDFKFNIGVNFTTYKSEIISLPGEYFDAGPSRIGTFVRNQVGQPISTFYGYKIIGFFSDSNDVAKSPTQLDAATGRFKYADLDGRDSSGNLTGRPDGKIDDADRTFLGNPNPDFTYGISLGGSYKNFDFSAIFYGSQGNDVINYTRYWTDFWASFQGNKSKDLLYNSWTPTHQDAKAPILENKSTNSTNTVVNSYYIENGSYFRCKSIQIGYTLSPSNLKRFGIDKLRVYLQAANLFTITKYTGLDPELPGANDADTDQPQTAVFGLDYGTYPNIQTYIVGVNLSF